MDEDALLAQALVSSCAHACVVAQLVHGVHDMSKQFTQGSCTSSAAHHLWYRLETLPPDSHEAGHLCERNPTFHKHTPPSLSLVCCCCCSVCLSGLPSRLSCVSWLGTIQMQQQTQTQTTNAAARGASPTRRKVSSGCDSYGVDSALTCWLLALCSLISLGHHPCCPGHSNPVAAAYTRVGSSQCKV